MRGTGTVLLGIGVLLLPVCLWLVGCRERTRLDAALLPGVVFASVYALFHIARLVFRRDGATETVSDGVPAIGAILVFFASCIASILLELALTPPLWAFAVAPALMGAALLYLVIALRRDGREFWGLVSALADAPEPDKRAAADAMIAFVTDAATREADKEVYAQRCMDTTICLLRYGYAADAEKVLSTIDFETCAHYVKPAVGCYLSEVRLRQGDLTGARQALRDLAEHPDLQSHRRLRLVMRARIAAAKGNAGGALQDLANAEDIILGDDQDFDGTVATVRRTTFEARAEACLAQGEDDEARAALEEMHTTMRGYVKALAMSKSAAAELAAEVVASHPEPDDAE